jgi:hypothetical protein
MATLGEFFGFMVLVSIGILLSLLLAKALVKPEPVRFHPMFEQAYVRVYDTRG